MFMRVNTLKFYPDILRRSWYWGSIVGKLINNLYDGSYGVWCTYNNTRFIWGVAKAKDFFLYKLIY